MKSPSTQPRGFTLLELILVMVILCIAMAISAPSLRGWSHGARLRDSAEQFLAAARYAHTQAIAQSKMHRLYVDPRAGSYWITVQDGEQFVGVGTDFGRVFTVSDGVEMQVSSPDATTPIEFIEFYPSGRSMPAVARFSDEAASYQVICRSPAEGYRLVDGKQGS